MFSHWSRPQLGLAPYAVQEVVHRKQNLATRGCMIASYCVDNSCCPWDLVVDEVIKKRSIAGRILASNLAPNLVNPQLGDGI